jgi:hypothetical protein
MDGVELCPRPGGMIVAAPTNDDQAIVVVFWPRQRRLGVKAGTVAPDELTPRRRPAAPSAAA